MKNNQHSLTFKRLLWINPVRLFTCISVCRVRVVSLVWVQLLVCISICRIWPWLCSVLWRGEGAFPQQKREKRLLKCDCKSIVIGRGTQRAGRASGITLNLFFNLVKKIANPLLLGPYAGPHWQTVFKITSAYMPLSPHVEKIKMQQGLFLVGNLTETQISISKICPSNYVFPSVPFPGSVCIAVTSTITLYHWPVRTAGVLQSLSLI